MARKPKALQAVPMSTVTIDGVREAAEADLVRFIKLVAPKRVLGGVHVDFCNFLTSEELEAYRLGLLPRGHQKSAMVAYLAAWRIVKNPAISILYISATSSLAEAQLAAIKGILESDKVKKYWPQLVHPEEGKRAKWSASAIQVDHPLRVIEQVRDDTVRAAGLTTNTTGVHADLIILDDIVVPDNNTSEGRRQVAAQCSQLQSILVPDGEVVAVGTRYHPKDQYQTFISTKEEQFNDAGEKIGSKDQWSVFQRVVEDSGDGTGQFLWPRQQRADGRWFGFDIHILAKKRAGYTDLQDYYAQYYNNPNDASTAPISSEMFEYYDKDKLTCSGGVWSVFGRPLNVFAAIDFAYSTTTRSDSTAIAVVGMDSEKRYFVLDIDRFKTDSLKVYLEHLLQLHDKYTIKRLRAETSVAQKVIVKQLKTKLQEAGASVIVEEYAPTTKKEERILATLKVPYEDHRIFHYRGGNCDILEEELTQARPAHDDVKNSLADAIAIATPPAKSYSNVTRVDFTRRVKRFGGM